MGYIWYWIKKYFPLRVKNNTIQRNEQKWKYLIQLHNCPLKSVGCLYFNVYDPVLQQDYLV